MSLNKLRVGCFMFRALHSLLPNYFNSMFVLNSDVHSHFTRHQSDLHLNASRLNIRKFSLKVFGPTLWNSVPFHIKASESLHQFSNSFKCYLFTSIWSFFQLIIKHRLKYKHTTSSTFLLGLSLFLCSFHLSFCKCKSVNWNSVKGG